MPGVTPKPVQTSSDPVAMLRADLENERSTVGHYRERIRQAEAMGEFALSETLRAIIVQEQEHEIDLSAALDIDVPLAKEPEHKSNGRPKGRTTLSASALRVSRARLQKARCIRRARAGCNEFTPLSTHQKATPNPLIGLD